MSIRLIAADLDGTLLNSHKEISPRSIQVLRRAAGEGCYVVPATGRCRLFLPPDVSKLPCPYLLLSSGASVIEQATGKQIYRAALTRNTLLSCRDVIISCHAVCNYTTDDASYIDSNDLRFVSSTLTARSSAGWAASFRAFQTPFDSFDQWIRDENPSVLKMNLFFCNPEERIKARRSLQEIPGIDVCSSISGNLEITDKKATKGIALRALADYLHLSLSEVIAFGDSDNDLSMIEAAGTGVAMANSVPELAAAADYITLSNDEDGVARGIEKWVFPQMKGL